MDKATPSGQTAARQKARVSRGLGAEGETAAAAFLAARGWEILERNWRPQGARHVLEIDLVARHQGVLVFVEVKTRSRRIPGAPASLPPAEIPLYASFTPQKQRNLVQAARHYLTLGSLWDAPCRFDLVCMERFPDGHFETEHFANVIELGQTLDRGDSSWQPW